MLILIAGGRVKQARWECGGHWKKGSNWGVPQPVSDRCFFLKTIADSPEDARQVG